MAEEKDCVTLMREREDLARERAAQVMPQPIIPDLDELIKRKPHQDFPMLEETYEKLRLVRPDLWERCMFCRGKAYFLDPDCPPDKFLMDRARDRRNKIAKENPLWTCTIHQ